MGENEPITQEQMNEFLFSQVVLMFQGAAWQHMGKVMNPVTNKVERDLAQAKHSIDMLAMLEAKTKGNLSDNEQRFLEHALYELRMNYIDEVNKIPDETDESSGESGDEAAESAEVKTPKDEETGKADEEESA